MNCKGCELKRAALLEVAEYLQRVEVLDTQGNRQALKRLTANIVAIILADGVEGLEAAP